MKKHIVTFFLLLFSTIAFILSFYVKDIFQKYCDIVAFVFPTIATVIEVVLSLKTDKENVLRDKKLALHEDSLTWKEF